MMIVDVHAHCGRWFFPSYCETPAQVGRLCDAYGIGRIVFSSSLAIVYDMESGNRQTAEFIQNDERFYGYVYLNPSDSSGSKSELEKYREAPRFVGVKLHPSYSGQAAGSEPTIEILREIPRHWVVLVHTWGRGGVQQTCQLAGKLPASTIIMGHMGGTAQEDWRAGIDGAIGLSNLQLEICGSFLQHDRISEAVRRIGADRVLFGSDLTLINPAFSLGQVLGSAIEEPDRRLILGENALRLIAFD